MSSRHRDWDNEDFGTSKPKRKDKSEKYGMLGVLRGMEGGVPFREPIMFRYEAKGAKLYNGLSPTNGEPQPFKKTKE